MTERLTTLAAVKAWLGISTDGSDVQLTQAIDAVSQFILEHLSIDSFQRRTYTQNFKGNGKSAVMLRSWPVLSVEAVATGGTSIAASTFNNTMPGSGYYVSDRRMGPQMLELQGYSFWNNAPSSVTYVAGFETSQTSVILADPLTITPTKDGLWSSDLGVTIDGVAAVKVDSAPITGQYSVDEWGTYTFAVADATKTAVISYSYTPPVVSYAAMQLVGEWYKMQDRIGIASKTLGGQETVVYLHGAMTEATRRMLQPFANVVPA